MNRELFQDLPFFIAVAQQGSFSRAAKHLKIQQPAVSKAVQRLEHRLNFPIFSRRRDGVYLTEKGEKLWNQCQPLWVAAEGIEESLSQNELFEREDLRVGTSDHLAIYLMSGTLRMFRKKHPSVRPRLFVGTSEDICEDLLRGEKDFALLMTVPPNKQLEVHALARVSSCVVVAKKNAKDIEVRKSFIGSREIDDSRNQSFPTLDRLKKTVPDTEIKVSCNSLEAQKRMVLDGVGIAILPEFMIREDLKKGLLSLVEPDFNFQARLKLVKKKGRPMSLPAKTFVENVTSALKKL